MWYIYCVETGECIHSFPTYAEAKRYAKKCREIGWRVVVTDD